MSGRCLYLMGLIPKTLGSHGTQNVLEHMTTQVNRDEGL